MIEAQQLSVCEIQRARECGGQLVRARVEPAQKIIRQAIVAMEEPPFSRDEPCAAQLASRQRIDGDFRRRQRPPVLSDCRRVKFFLAIQRRGRWRRNGREDDKPLIPVFEREAREIKGLLKSDLGKAANFHAGAALRWARLRAGRLAYQLQPPDEQTEFPAIGRSSQCMRRNRGRKTKGEFHRSGVVGDDGK